MADRSNGGRQLPPPPGPPQPDNRDQREAHPRSPRASSAPYPYPPQSNEWEDRRPPPFHLPPMAQPTVTLPPIHGIYQQAYAPQPGPSNPPPVDPRLAPSNYAHAPSPTSGNGHGPPPPGPPPQGAPYPPYHGPPPGGPHGGPPPGGPPPGPYADYYAMHRPPAYPAPPPNGYGPYQGYPAGPYGEYVQGHPQQQQIAPRQRTSIACRYCRKRKIRCSGYQNTTNGKCTNCDKLKIDCIFQPVSSGVSQAFIPVSAIPGGVPPGTQLFGAYGQPLPPSAPGQNQNGYPPPPPPQYQQQPPPPPHHHHHHQQQQQPPLISPTSQYAPQTEGEQHGRRRPRESDEEDRNARLPPPPAPDAYHQQQYDGRRRSPVSNDSNTPPMYHYHHSTRSFEADRTPTPRRNSSGHSPTTSTMSAGVHSPTSASFPPPPPGSHALAPPHQTSQMPAESSRSPAHVPSGGRSPTGNGLPVPGPKSPTTSTDGAGSASIMSLGNLVQGPSSVPFRGSDIDNGMLGKLNRRT